MLYFKTWLTLYKHFQGFCIRTLDSSSRIWFKWHVVIVPWCSSLYQEYITGERIIATENPTAIQPLSMSTPEKASKVQVWSKLPFFAFFCSFSVSDDFFFISWRAFLYSKKTHRLCISTLDVKADAFQRKRLCLKILGYKFYGDSCR